MLSPHPVFSFVFNKKFSARLNGLSRINNYMAIEVDHQSDSVLQLADLYVSVSYSCNALFTLYSEHEMGCIIEQNVVLLMQGLDVFAM